MEASRGTGAAKSSESDPHWEPRLMALIMNRVGKKKIRESKGRRGIGSHHTGEE